MAEEIVQRESWDLTSVGLRIRDPEMTYEVFEGLCEHLGQSYATVREADWALKFAIGDAIVQGEALFGEKAYQAFERFGMSEEVLRECARVSQRVSLLHPPRQDAMVVAPSGRGTGAEQAERVCSGACRKKASPIMRSGTNSETERWQSKRNAGAVGGVRMPHASSHCRCCGRPYDSVEA